MRLYAVALPIIVAISFALLANPSPPPPVGGRPPKRIADFTLRDHHGREHSLRDQSDKKLVVGCGRSRRTRFAITSAASSMNPEPPAGPTPRCG